MTKRKAAEIANSLFGSYPSAEVFHITYDGQAFLEDHAARSHARSFKRDVEQVVVSVSRGDVEAILKDDQEVPAKDSAKPAESVIDGGNEGREVQAEQVNAAFLERVAKAEKNVADRKADLEAAKGRGKPKAEAAVIEAEDELAAARAALASLEQA